ncbi:MAG: hypothetical protein JWM34_1790 [Ilumatobacteraceae bacterium]|nr:hypothetical protein [Ilumatobacteraceae bacterium]
MNPARHVYEIYIRATPEQVWQALVDPAFTVRYFHRTAVESTFVKGAPYRYVMGNGNTAIEGEIEEIEPGRRIVMSFQFQNHSGMPVEPPSRVEWVVTPTGEATRLTLRHTDLFKSPLTWESVRMGWLPVIDGLKTVLETGESLGMIDDPEADELSGDPEGEWHRAQGIAANNGTWDWLGKPDGERTADDDEQMTLSAYAAAYHWARAAGTGPANTARANWLLSRVWVVRGNGALALHHADIVMETCHEHDLHDFDLAYPHEARARALACLGRHDEAAAERSTAAAVPIVDDEDRSIFDPDLAAEPWFGLDPLPV